MSKLWKLLTGSDRDEYSPSKGVPTAPIYDMKAHVAHVKGLHAKHPYKSGAATVKLTDECVAAIEHGLGRSLGDLDFTTRLAISTLLSWSNATWSENYQPPENRESLQKDQTALTDLNRAENVQLILVELFATILDNVPKLEKSTLTIPLHTITKNFPALVNEIMRTFTQTSFFPFLTTTLMQNAYRKSGVEPGSGKKLKVPSETDDPIEFLRDTPLYNFFMRDVPFAIPQKALSEHCFIVAKPGHGKTVLLSSFAAQFLQDPTQPGLFCLDPAGDWFEKLRERVPPERLVVLDPETDPPPLNFFSFGSSTEAEMLQSFSYLMSSLSGGLSDKQSAIVPYLLKLLRRIPDASLETLRLIVDEKVRGPNQSTFATAIAALPDVDQGFFHNQFYSGTMGETKQAIAWKIYNALSRDAFRQMFSAPTNSFDAPAAMRERKVVLVRGSENTLGEHGLAVFLQFVVSQFFLASLARFRIPEKDRHQCYLLCDEASHIFNPQIKRILVECRKLGLSLFSATQVIDQIPTEVKASIYGATSIKCAGNVAHSDAQQMAREMRTDGDAIQRLKTFEWMMHVSDMDRAVKVVVRPGALEALPKQKASPVLSKPPLPIPQPDRPASASENRVADLLADLYDDNRDEFKKALDDDPVKKPGGWKT